MTTRLGEIGGDAAVEINRRQDPPPPASSIQIVLHFCVIKINRG
jgi:hypothetical protein